MFDYFFERKFTIAVGKRRNHPQKLTLPIRGSCPSTSKESESNFLVISSKKTWGWLLARRKCLHPHIKHFTTDLRKQVGITLAKFPNRFDGFGNNVDWAILFLHRLAYGFGSELKTWPNLAAG
jgi:hypothetical protein